MGIDGGVSSCTSQILVFSVGDMQMCARISVFLGETKVDDVHLVSTFSKPHQEIVGFNISVQEALGVYVFDTGYLKDNIAEIGQRKG